MPRHPGHDHQLLVAGRPTAVLGRGRALATEQAANVPAARHTSVTRLSGRRDVPDGEEELAASSRRLTDGQIATVGAGQTA